MRKIAIDPIRQMQLKNYQQNALDQLDLWFKESRKEKKEVADIEEFYTKKGKIVPANLKNYPRSAWQNLKEQNLLPGSPQGKDIAVPDHIPRTATSGEPIPHVCLKVPTGGGKTLLGASALGHITQGIGFVLWIVPTKAIYEQTIKAFRTREHLYRQMLESISGNRFKLLQKNDRFTRQDVTNHLCIMMLMLPSANRKKGRDFLKIFRDSGGYMSFFPEQDNMAANQALTNNHRDLEKSKTGDFVKQSLINVLKLIRPTVILDEAHKAYGTSDANNKEFVKSINRLNPSLVLELSATPKIGISNILVNISGEELQDEEMIKLPIEIRSFGNSNWKHTLAETQHKLDELEAKARKLQAQESRYVRPIALVRVTYTGKAQRDKPGVHAEDARKYLVRNLAVPENQIRVQSSERKELAGENLLSEMSEVRWIITKDALKEGWDCSFAYVLSLLDRTTATTAMTQMVGRVMRQPHARRIKKSPALNRCYIYCYNQDVSKAVEGVRAGLENEGLAGLGGSIRGNGEGDAPKKITISRRKEYKKLRIFLPQVLHKEGTGWRQIDYDRDILNAVNWEAVSVGRVVNLDDEELMQVITATISIHSENIGEGEPLDTAERLQLNYFVQRLTDIIPNPWQAARMVQCFLQKHKNRKYNDSQLLNNRIYLSEVLRRNVRADIDDKAESVFRYKIKRNEIRFHLETDEQLNYKLDKSFEVFVSSKERALQAKHGKVIQRSLFEPVYESDFNALEKDFALYLEKSNAIYWWHRIAARRAYHLQGWRRQRVYPDFVACIKGDGKLLILETKGAHLQGNEDTAYKEKLLKTLETTYKTALDRGEMTVREPSDSFEMRRMRFRMLYENKWQDDMNALVSDNK